VCKFVYVLILVTPSGGFIFGKAKERACPASRTNIVVVIGRENVKLEGDFRGTRPVTLTTALSPHGRERSRKGPFIGRELFTLTSILSP
jgi:hypothetical protein